MSSALLLLPKELREIIYTYALRSSTGLVIYKRNIHSIREHYGHNQNFKLYAASHPSSHHYDPLTHEQIAVSFTHTNRQIYAETKDLLWTLNVLVFDTAEMPNIIQQLRVQHVLLQYRLDEDDRRHQPTPLPKTISILSRWAQEGNLKSITMRTREPLQHPYDATQHVERIVEGHNRRWRAACEAGGPLSNIFRMVIFTGVNLYAIHNGCRPTVVLDVIQENLNSAIGGEIWTEGVLCWKDGKQVARAWSAFEWIEDHGMSSKRRPRVVESVRKELERLPDERAIHAAPFGGNRLR